MAAASPIHIAEAQTNLGFEIHRMDCPPLPPATPRALDRRANAGGVPGPESRRACHRSRAVATGVRNRADRISSGERERSSAALAEGGTSRGERAPTSTCGRAESGVATDLRAAGRRAEAR